MAGGCGDVASAGRRGVRTLCSSWTSWDQVSSIALCLRQDHVIGPCSLSTCNSLDRYFTVSCTCSPRHGRGQIFLSGALASDVTKYEQLRIWLTSDIRAVRIWIAKFIQKESYIQNHSWAVATVEADETAASSVLCNVRQKKQKS